MGLQGTEDLPRTFRSLKNCFNNGAGKVLGFPGITELKTTSRTARGSFEWNGSLYQVVSNDLIKITNKTTGDFSVIGTILGSADIRTAFGFNDAVIVVKGGALYTLDKSDVLTDISNEDNIVSSVDVTHINGRFVYIPADGDPAFFSDIGAADTVNVLSFFDAEELPDKNNAVFNFGNTLYIMGTDSMELFRDSGATPNPFARVPGARLFNGFIGGLLEYNQTYLFIGREKGQDFGIYRIGSGQAPKISNEKIDLILSTYSQTELEQAVSGRIKWRGYDLATFSLQRDSFGYYGDQWFLLDTVADGVSRPWSGGFITQFEGEYFSAFRDKIGKFSNINTAYGERITRTIDLGFESEDGGPFACQSIELGISQGFNTEDGSVALMMSRDNVQYGPPVYRNLGALGKYQDKLKWNPPGGLGTYNGFMGVRLYTTEDIVFNNDYLIANFR